MFNRRLLKQTDTLERRLSEEAKQLREVAELLRPGPVRDATLRRARQAETRSHIGCVRRVCSRPSEVLNRSPARYIPERMSDEDIARFRAQAEDCRQQAERAISLLDKELRLAGEWIKLVQDAEQRRG